MGTKIIINRQFNFLMTLIFSFVLKLLPLKWYVHNPDVLTQFFISGLQYMTLTFAHDPDLLTWP